MAQSKQRTTTGRGATITRSVSETRRTVKKDRIFNTNGKVKDFSFDETTAAVFDDMLERSVPFYAEMQRMMVELARLYVKPGKAVYDLGCSTGTTLLNLMSALGDVPLTYVGIDLSEPMLKKASVKLKKYLPKHSSLELRAGDLNQVQELPNACVAVMALTLQFIRPLNRENVVQGMYNQLEKNGCVLFIEKVLGNNSLFNRQFIDLYYDFKRRNGYSDLEIAKKREALENVLIPYRLDENIALLDRCGFSSVEVFFKWYNFCGLIAVK